MTLNIRSLFSLLLLGILSSPLSAQIVITEVMSSSSHPDGSSSGDWFELTNTGTADIDLDGYYWDDGMAGDDGALFPSFMLTAGSSVVVAKDEFKAFETDWCGGFDVLTEDLFSGPDTFSGLSSNGDSVILWDADPINVPGAQIVTSVSFGAATEGFSFEWATNGADLGLSAVGEFGAFTACDDGTGLMMAGTDVGSPGFATVPEPSAIVLLLFGAIAFLRRR
jgi:hypothetical protein